MNLSVKAALLLEPLRKARLIAGAKGTDRIIRCVDISETPDSYLWFRADELIVTTCYSIRDDLDTQLTLLRSLSSVGGAALAVKFGRFIGAIPTAMLALADELELPLISLPDDLPFIDITHPIMTAILNEQARRLAYSEKVYRTLTAVALEGSGLGALSGELGGLIGADVSIHAGPPPRGPGSAGRPKNCFPVQVKSKTYGYIAVTKPQPLTAEDSIAIGHAQILAALQMINKELLNESARNYRRDFVEDLLHNRIRRAESAAARAGEIGFSLNEACQLLLVDIDGFAGYLLKNKVTERRAANLKRLLLELTENAVREAGRRALVVPQSDAVVAILPIRAQRREPGLEALLETIRAQAAAHLDGLTVTAAGSDPITHYTAFGKKYGQLQKIIALSRKINGGDRAVARADAELYLLLDRMDDALLPFCQSLLGAIDQAEVKNRQTWLRTLQAYLDCGGNLTATAEQLYIHRNTLRYRLRCIEERIRRPLHSPETRFLLWLALKARHIQ